MKDVLFVVGIMAIITGLSLMCGNLVVSAIKLYNASPKVFWDVMMFFIPIIMVVIGTAMVIVLGRAR